jgi:Na+-exporting ATPase
MPKEADGPSYYPGCETVYRARATSFLFLTYALLLHAYNCRSFRYSIFFSKKYGGWHNVVSNKLLFFSVIIGAIVSASTVYIPG